MSFPRPSQRLATGGAALAAAVLATLGLAACTGSPGVSMSTVPPVPMSGRGTGATSGGSGAASVASGSPTGTAPIVAGPTTAADGTCPWLSLDEALDDAGERLGRVTTSTSGGAVVGCAFYAASGALATSERLPPTDTPVIAIVLTRYASPTAAHNAMVEGSRVDPAAGQVDVTGADEAVAYATSFYAPDGNTDPACAFRKGDAVVLIQLADPKASYNVGRIADNVAPRIS